MLARIQDHAGDVLVATETVAELDRLLECATGRIRLVVSGPVGFVIFAVQKPARDLFEHVALEAAEVAFSDTVLELPAARFGEETHVGLERIDIVRAFARKRAQENRGSQEECTFRH